MRQRVKRRVQLAPFEIQTESGRRVRILGTQEILDVSSQDFQGADAEISGDVVLRTEDGGEVIDCGDGTYEIVQSGLRGRRVR